MKIMKNRASKFGRFKYKKYQKPNPSRGKYNNTENRGFPPTFGLLRKALSHK